MNPMERWEYNHADNNGDIGHPIIVDVDTRGLLVLYKFWQEQKQPKHYSTSNQNAEK